MLSRTRRFHDLSRSEWPWDFVHPRGYDRAAGLLWPRESEYNSLMQLGCVCMDPHLVPVSYRRLTCYKNSEAPCVYLGCKRKIPRCWKSKKSSPVGAAPWQNLTDWQTVKESCWCKADFSHHSRLQLSSCSQEPVHGATVARTDVREMQLDLAIDPAQWQTPKALPKLLLERVSI